MPAELARAVRARVGPRGLSAFTARALRRELEHAELSELLAELEGALGPVEEALVAEADESWPTS